MAPTRVVPPRDEGGKLATADNLHSHYNRILKCANCLNTNTSNGLFLKNTAGKKNKDGRRSRRYVCRCGKSYSVTHFLDLCHQDPNVSFQLPHLDNHLSGISYPVSPNFSLFIFYFIHIHLIHHFKTNIFQLK